MHRRSLLPVLFLSLIAGTAVADEPTPDEIAATIRSADLGADWSERRRHTGETSAGVYFQERQSRATGRVDVFVQRWGDADNAGRYFENERARAKLRRRGASYKNLPRLRPEAYVAARAAGRGVKTHWALALARVGPWVLTVLVEPSARNHSTADAEATATHLLRLLLERSRLVDGPAEDPKIRVRLELDDPDGLTPADEATLRLGFERAGSLDGYRAVVSLVGEVATGEGVRPLPQPKSGTSRKFTDTGPPLVFLENGTGTQRLELRLAGARSHEATTKLRVAGEDNLWIYRRLIDPPIAAKTGTTARTREIAKLHRRKPDRERHVLLDETAHVRVISRDGEVVFDDRVSIRSRNGVAKLQFPDYSALAGTPPDPQARAYYRDGDSEWSYAGHPYVRAVALRAARYDHESKTWRGRSLPENDLDELVHNVAWFVHDKFQPKDFPAKIYDAGTLANDLLELRKPGQGKPSMIAKLGRFVPYRETKAEALACIEHAYTFNAILRALGIPARAINSMTHFFGVSLVQIGTAQDAASEAWYRANGEPEARWHFFSLFHDAGRPIEDPAERYGGPCSVFDLWVGTRPWRALPGRDEETRFDVEKLEQYGVWQYYGYGGTWNFVPFWKRADAPPGILAERMSYISYRLGSPVAATVVTSDGKRVGTRAGPIDLEAVTRWFLLGRKGAAPPGVVNEVKGALCIPEGTTLFRSNDPRSAQQLPLTIVLPDPSNGAEPPPHTLEIIGTGTGPYTLDVASVTPAGVMRYKRLTGTVTPGKRISVEPGSLVPGGVRASWPSPRITRAAPEAPTSEKKDRPTTKHPKLAPLLEQLRSGNADRAMEAALGLGDLGDARAIPALAAALHGNDDFYVRLSAATALGMIRDADGADALVKALYDRDPLVRTAAREALWKILGTTLRIGDPPRPYEASTIDAAVAAAKARQALGLPHPEDEREARREADAKRASAGLDAFAEIARKLGRGRVLELQKQGTVAIVSLGTSDGVRLGDTIIVRRGNAHIALLKVLEVTKGLARVRVLEDLLKARPRVGDQVVR